MDKLYFRSKILPSLLLLINEQYVKSVWKKTWDQGGPHYPKEVYSEKLVSRFTNDLKRMLEDLDDEIDVLSYILFGLVTYQAFKDCNHRTAWTMFKIFARIFEMDYLYENVSDDDAATFVKLIGSMYSKEEVKSYLLRRRLN